MVGSVLRGRLGMEGEWMRRVEEWREGNRERRVRIGIGEKEMGEVRV